MVIPYFFIVAFPSEANMRWSDWRVKLETVIIGSIVVPLRYSATLTAQTVSYRLQETTIQREHTHIVSSYASVPSNFISVPFPGTIFGKSTFRTPPNVCPQATRLIISVALKPCSRKRSVCMSSVSCGCGTPRRPAASASVRPPRNGRIGPPHEATPQTTPRATRSAPDLV